MSTECFIVALGASPKEKDNARTFQAAKRELAELIQVFTDSKMAQNVSQNGVTWKFIAPRAAWLGGFWKRMVGTTKQCLRKLLGRSQADEGALLTLLVEIEAVLNTRPIVQDD
jgi:hypothetical protein